MLNRSGTVYSGGMSTSVFRLMIGFAGAATLLWPQAMTEYALGVGRAGVAGTSIKNQPLKQSLQRTGRAVQHQPARGGRGGRRGGPVVPVYTLEDEAARNREKLGAQAGEQAATLQLKASDGAVISLDSTVVGRSSATLKLAPGKYRLRVAAPGYVTRDEQVELAERDTREMTLHLDRAMSTANVIQIGARANP